MLGENVSFATRTVNITVEHSWKMETYREHPRHCKLWIYGVELRSTMGKDATRHQSRPTSYCEERCCEPLLDGVLLQRCQTRMLLPRSHVKRLSLVRGSRGLVSEGGHLISCLPHYHLWWDLRLLHSLLPSGLVTVRGFCYYEPQCQTRVCLGAAQQLSYPWVPHFSLEPTTRRSISSKRITWLAQWP